MGSTQRALELQQLAAGSTTFLESSQLSAAAQLCTAEAEEAAQVAALARAEAERLSAAGPAAGPSPESPAAAAAMTAVTGSADGHVTNSEAALISTSELAEEAADSAAAAATPRTESLPRSQRVADPRRGRHDELSRSSADVIRGLSSDMHAAMQHLIASANSSSSALLIAQTESLGWAGLQPGDSDIASGLESSQGLSQTQASDSRAGAAGQTQKLPYQAHWQIPAIGTGPLLRAASGSAALPDPTTGGRSQDPSGMQLHLMHQLEGLERSVRRVEQQVSSTKQTRRRLKTASLPTGVSSLLLHVLCSSCFDWVSQFGYQHSSTYNGSSHAYVILSVCWPSHFLLAQNPQCCTHICDESHIVQR